MVQKNKRVWILALPLMAIVLALAAAACSDSGDGSGGTTTAGTGGTAATSGCDEVNALKDSLTSLTQVDLTSGGTDALESAASDVKTDLDAAVSAVGMPIFASYVPSDIHTRTV